MRQRKHPTKFQKDVTKFLIYIGATPQLDGYAFALDTELGKLEISPYDNWIACCWADVPRAKAGKAVEPHSFTGKWNFHCFKSDGKRVAIRSENILAQFIGSIQYYTPPDGKAKCIEFWVSRKAKQGKHRSKQL
jgi:hypothetical protein